MSLKKKINFLGEFEVGKLYKCECCGAVVKCVSIPIDDGENDCGLIVAAKSSHDIGSSIDLDTNLYYEL